MLIFELFLDHVFQPLSSEKILPPGFKSEEGKDVAGRGMVDSPKSAACCSPSALSVLLVEGTVALLSFVGRSIGNPQQQQQQNSKQWLQQQ